MYKLILSMHHASDYASSQVVKPIYNRLNYQEFLYNSIADTFDFSKMWDMSHFFKLDLRLKTNQTCKFTLNLS